MPVTYFYKTFAKKFGMYCLIRFVSKAQYPIFIARGKVMFSEASVSHSVHGGVWRGAASGGVGGQTPHIGYYGIRSTSGRYASYWNAFLFINDFKCIQIVTEFCLRFIYRVNANEKAMSFANYCIVPGCMFILKRCLSDKRSKKKLLSLSPFAFSRLMTLLMASHRKFTVVTSLNA